MLEKNVKKPVRSPLRSKEASSTKPEEKEINLEIKDAQLTGSVGKEIPMHELLKAQKQIDENNLKAGIKKEPISRPRSKQNLPIANK